MNTDSQLFQTISDGDREREDQVITFPAPTGPTTANNGFSYKNNHSKNLNIHVQYKKHCRSTISNK